MSETFGWIESGTHGRLASVLHLPDASGPFPAVLFCHGFTGTRVEPQRLFLSFARRLAEKGLAVLRFDFGGHGESEGLFQDLTLSGELQDADAAWDFLGRVPQVDPSRRGLLGFSLGGYVAARCAAGFADSGLKALALWAPVEDPRCITMHFGGLHGEEKMASGGMVDIGGLSLGPGFVRDLIRQVSQKPGEGWRGPVFLAQGDRDQAVPLRAMDDYRATFLRQGADFQGLVLQSAKHLFDDVVSRGRLYDGTESFLLRHLRDGKTPETGRP